MFSQSHGKQLLTNDFATVFDLAYCAQALTMARSLRSVCPTARVWMFCLDSETAHIVEQEVRNEPWLRPVPLANHETHELLASRAEKSIGEYCWTLTPFLPDFVLSLDPSIRIVTYVDADVLFLKDPSPLLAEFTHSSAYALITEHAYASEYDQSSTSGRFCVQFNSFKVAEAGPLLERWQRQVLDWCFARFEDGKMGDQMYLDEWPHLYGDHVMIVGPTGEFQGPWNASRFPYSSALAFHFHSLAWGPKGRVHVGNYTVPLPTLVHVYQPYLQRVKAARRSVTENSGVDPMQALTKGHMEFLRLRLRAYRNALRRRRFTGIAS